MPKSPVLSHEVPLDPVDVTSSNKPTRIRPAPLDKRLFQLHSDLTNKTIVPEPPVSPIQLRRQVESRPADAPYIWALATPEYTSTTTEKLPDLGSTSSGLSTFLGDDNSEVSRNSLESMQGIFIQKILEAYELGQIDNVQKLVEKNPDLGMAYNGVTPLQHFIKLGNTDLAGIILECLPLIYSYSKIQRADLVRLAVDYNNHLILQTLLETGCYFEPELLDYINKKEGLSSDTHKVINNAKRIKVLVEAVVIEKNKTLDYVIRALLQDSAIDNLKRSLFTMFFTSSEDILLIMDEVSLIERFVKSLIDSELTADVIHNLISNYKSELIGLQVQREQCHSSSFQSDFGRYDFGELEPVVCGPHRFDDEVDDLDYLERLRGTSPARQ